GDGSVEFEVVEMIEAARNLGIPREQVQQEQEKNGHHARPTLPSLWTWHGLRHNWLMRILLAAVFFAPLVAAQDATIRLQVDATDVSRRLYHIHMTMPVKAGPMTLLYPQWIPGEHSPTGPITDLVGLKIQAGSQAIQ